MKVLFFLKNENFMAPLGLLTIAAVAKKNGHESFLCEINARDPFLAIDEVKPDIIAYSSATGEAKHYFSLNRAVKGKHPGIFTIMGGAHPTFFHESLKETTLDALCVGEGEGAMADVLSALSEKKELGPIDNIVTKNHRSLKLRPLIEDLDTLPFPDYSLIYDNTDLGKVPLKSFISSRGCPYPCSYCFNQRWLDMYRKSGQLKRIVRRHSVDYLIDNIKFVRSRWPLSSVKFYDDIFSFAADSWLEEFSRKYRKEINLPFFILTRADLLNEEMVKLLKEAGCRTVSMSIESGVYGVRKELLRRDMTDEQIIRAHRLCRRHGIYTFTNSIIGLPGTKFSDDLRSLELSLEAGVDWGEFVQFYPYPGTELGDRTIAEDLYAPDYDTMHTSYQYESPLSCFSPREKRWQRNLAVLGPVAITFPFCRGIIIRLLRFYPNRIFTLFYYLSKMLVFRRKIYVTKTGFGESIRIFLKSLRQDMYRHAREKVYVPR